MMGALVVCVYNGDVQTPEFLKKIIIRKNLIVNTGKNLASRLLGGDTSATYAAISYLALGTGTTAAAATDTVLQTEVFRKPISSISYAVTGKVIFDTTVTTQEANNYSISELGWLNSQSAGTLWNHIILTGGNIITKTSDRSLAVTYTVTFT